MAEINSIQQQPKARTLNFDAGATGLYQLQDGASRDDIHNQLNARLGQLVAMLNITYGGGQESYERWSDEIKDNYMWAAAMIAQECQELAEHL